jgi:hypothetical protein
LNPGEPHFWAIEMSTFSQGCCGRQVPGVDKTGRTCHCHHAGPRSGDVPRFPKIDIWGCINTYSYHF